MILCLGSSDQAGKQSWIDPFEPVAVQIIAQFGDEATIFRLAAQIETTRPWKDRLPPLMV